MKLGFYILREHLIPFFLALFLITFLFIVDLMVRLLDAILSKGLDFWVITELFFLNTAWMLALSVPMSCLVASLLAFGRLAADNEIMALRANGLSPLRILFPVLVVGTAICVGLVLFNNYVLPEANHRAAALRSDITRQKAPAFITPRVLVKDFQNYRIWVDSIDYDHNFLFGVKIYSWEGQEPPRYMTASKALMEYSPDGTKMLIHLEKGENHVVDTKNVNRYLRIQFQSQTVSIDNIDASLVRRDRNYRSDREMSMGQIMEVIEQARQQKVHNDSVFPISIWKYMTEIDSLLRADTATSSLPPRLVEGNWWDNRPVTLEYYQKALSQAKDQKREMDRYNRQQLGETKREYKYLVEYHKKISLPVACILFVIVGGSLGMTSRKGSLWVGVVIGCGCFLLYWISLLRGEAMADKLEMKPWLAMWISNILVGFFSIVFLIRSVVLLRK